MNESSSSLYSSLHTISTYGAPFKLRHRHRARGAAPLNLLESQIRYSMENTRTCQEAARWLNIDYNTFKRYAILYIDKETNKNLFDLHRDNNASKRRTNSEKIRREKAALRPPSSRPAGRFVAYPIQDILDNKHPNYSYKDFKKRLLKENILPECCENCGYSMRRDFDYQVPLILHFKDADRSNFSLSNVRFLCYNCYFLLVGNPVGANKKVVELPDGTLVPITQAKRYLRKLKQLKTDNL